MRNAPLNFKYKPHQTTFTRRSKKRVQREREALMQDETRTEYGSTSEIKSNNRIASKSTGKNTTKSSLLDASAKTTSRKVGTHADREKGTLKNISTPNDESIYTVRSENGMSRPEDKVVYIYKGKDTGDLSHDGKLRGYATIRGKDYVQSYGARHDVISNRNKEIKEATKGMTPAQKKAYIKQEQDSFLRGVGREGAVDTNLRATVETERQRIISDQNRFEGQVGADKLRLDNVYNNK